MVADHGARFKYFLKACLARPRFSRRLVRIIRVMNKNFGFELKPAQIIYNPAPDCARAQNADFTVIIALVIPADQPARFAPALMAFHFPHYAEKAFARKHDLRNDDFRHRNAVGDP
jgi:hypothetical protein